MAFKFEYTGKMSDGRGWDQDSTKRITFELDDNDVTVSELLEEFMNFLQGTGYKFELGDRFEVVNDFKELAKVTGDNAASHDSQPETLSIKTDPY